MIKEAVKDLTVEIWDWKKVDIRISAVPPSSSNAIREIILYSSGDNEVLELWVHSSRLSSVEKFPNVIPVFQIFFEQ